MYLFQRGDRTGRRVGCCRARSRPLRAKRLPFRDRAWPPYRLAAVRRRAGAMMWGKSSMFLREAGTVILACPRSRCGRCCTSRTTRPDGAPDYDAIRRARATQRRPRGAASAARRERTRLPARQQLRRPARPRDRGRRSGPGSASNWKIGVGIIGAFRPRAEVFVSTPRHRLRRRQTTPRPSPSRCARR